VTPSASIAAARGWIPSAQSVPAARASSANWASGPIAPLTSEGGDVIAGVGVSGGTTEQDIAIVEAAIS
jgi:uncharacterized protein GlcG (DUF336 family)